MKGIPDNNSDIDQSYYRAKMYAAQNEIKIAMHQSLLTAKGRHASGSRPNNNPIVTIRNLPMESELEYRLHSIITGSANYDDIEFDFAELQKALSTKVSETRGRKSILSQHQLEKLQKHAKKLKYRLQKEYICDCIKWVKTTFDLDIPYETIRGYIKDTLPK